MNNPAMVKKEDGNRVSGWVVGFYESNTLCQNKIIRACQVGKTVEWEYADGEGVDADLFEVSAPDSWRPLDV
jgi:hypothetical protein